VPLSRNLGTLTSWNPLGLSRPVTGLTYLLTVDYRIRQHPNTIQFCRPIHQRVRFLLSTVSEMWTTIFPFSRDVLLVFVDPHKCRESRTVHEKRDFSYFVIRHVITVNVTYYEGRGERKWEVTLIWSWKPDMRLRYVCRLEINEASTEGLDSRKPTAGVNDVNRRRWCLLTLGIALKPITKDLVEGKKRLFQRQHKRLDVEERK